MLVGGAVFTRLSEYVHSTVVVDPVITSTTDRGNLVPACIIEGIPRKQPVVPLVGVRVVNTQFQLTLIQVGHFAIVRGRL